MLKRRMFRALGLALVGLLSACGPVKPTKPKMPMLDVDVTWLQAGIGGPSGPFSFAVEAAHGAEPLVDQRLQELLTQGLTAKGARADAGSPEWSFRVSHAVSEGEKVLPAKHRQESYWQDGQLKEVTRYRNGVPTEAVVSNPGRWKEKNVAEPGGVKAVHIIKFSVQAYLLPIQPGDLPRWEGSVVASQDAPDPLKHAPAMLRELLREFPMGSGAPSHRKVPAR
jgi:hypothetical protein